MFQCLFALDEIQAAHSARETNSAVTLLALGGTPRDCLRNTMLGTIAVIVIVLMLFGALPRWPHSRNWGYAPSGGLGLILLILVLLVVMGRI
jgi:hypothetical protein